LGPDALRLSAEEAAAALELVSGHRDESTRAAVIDLCEGWAAGSRWVSGSRPGPARYRSRSSSTSVSRTMAVAMCSRRCAGSL
ncbi:hypothetical protein C6A85_16030, partial [Mycobacterium sp. ITM-2017-0098]